MRFSSYQILKIASFHSNMYKLCSMDKSLILSYVFTAVYIIFIGFENSYATPSCSTKLEKKLEFWR